MSDKIKFKSEKVKERFQEVHPLVKNLAINMEVWASNEGLPFVITEAKTTKEEDAALSRQSATHREGRAIDVSVVGWKKEQIDRFVSLFNQLFKDVGAIMKNGPPKLVVFHNSGHGDHLHIQIRRM
jgi:hypothetical protein